MFGAIKRMAGGVSDSFFALVSPSVSGNLGTGKNVWTASDQMAKLYPFPIKTQGELTEGEVTAMRQNAEKMSLQAALWGDYAGAVDEAVGAYASIVTSRAGVGVAMAKGRVKIAQAEEKLGVAVIDAETQIRKSIGNMAIAQRKLSMPDLLQKAIYD